MSRVRTRVIECRDKLVELASEAICCQFPHNEMATEDVDAESS
jgi:hypothetical protein